MLLLTLSKMYGEVFIIYHEFVDEYKGDYVFREVTVYDIADIFCPYLFSDTEFDGNQFFLHALPFIISFLSKELKKI